MAQVVVFVCWLRVAVCCLLAHGFISFDLALLIVVFGSLVLRVVRWFLLFALAVCSCEVVRVVFVCGLFVVWWCRLLRSLCMLCLFCLVLWLFVARCRLMVSLNGIPLLPVVFGDCACAAVTWAYVVVAVVCTRFPVHYRL